MTHNLTEVQLRKIVYNTIKESIYGNEMYFIEDEADGGIYSNVSDRDEAIADAKEMAASGGRYLVKDRDDNVIFDTGGPSYKFESVEEIGNTHDGMELIGKVGGRAGRKYMNDIDKDRSFQTYKDALGYFTNAKENGPDFGDEKLNDINTITRRDRFLKGYNDEYNKNPEVKCNESQLREYVSSIIRESLEELGGFSFGNFVRNGHFRTNAKSSNPIIQIAWQNGWELTKADEQNIEGEYQAQIMDGAFGDVTPDENGEETSHPKVSWPMLIANLNKNIRQQGYFAAGSHYHKSGVSLMGRETNNSELIKDFGIITVTKR